MPAWSIVNFSSLGKRFDFDAEHYHPDRLAIFKKLRSGKHRPLSDYAKQRLEIIVSGNLGNCFDTTDALGNFLSAVGGDNTESAKKIACPGDVIISRLRSYLQQICVIPERPNGFLPHLSTEFVVLSPSNQDSIHWVLPFLLCDQVQTVLRWAQTGSNHPRFDKSTLLSIPVPATVDRLISKLNELIATAVKEVELARSYYPEAEIEMLERLGWSELAEQPRELFFSTSISKLSTASRNDAEFFHPFCHRLRSATQKSGGKTIGDFCTKISRGLQPEISEHGSVIALDSKSIRPHGVEPSGERVTQEFHDSDFAAKGRVRPGDVLLNSTGRGTLGRAAYYQLKSQAVCDNHVAILRPDPKVCSPRYLALFLNSPAGLTQSDQFQTGSSGQLEIYPQHIKQFLVFLPRNKSGEIDLAWQEKLAAKVEASTRAREQAQAKLAEAKKLVEDALANGHETNGDSQEN